MEKFYASLLYIRSNLKIRKGQCRHAHLTKILTQIQIISSYMYTCTYVIILIRYRLFFLVLVSVSLVSLLLIYLLIFLCGNLVLGSFYNYKNKLLIIFRYFLPLILIINTIFSVESCSPLCSLSVFFLSAIMRSGLSLTW